MKQYKHKFLIDTTNSEEKDYSEYLKNNNIKKTEAIRFSNKENWLSINDVINEVDADYITYITLESELKSKFKDILVDNLSYKEFDLMLPLVLHYDAVKKSPFLKNSLFWSSFYGDSTDNHGLLKPEILKVFKETPYLLTNFEGVGLTFKKETFIEVGGFTMYDGNKLIKLVFDFIKKAKSVITSNKLMVYTEKAGLDVFDENRQKISDTLLEKWMDELTEEKIQT